MDAGLNLGLSAARGNVATVMIDGRFVKRGGALVGIDTAGIRAELTRARDRLYAAGEYADPEYGDAKRPGPDQPALSATIASMPAIMRP
ncbi:hypothetical protein [Streptomyces sp. GbtcB6]|uniref:hypothetical protein n=1 Tax=Streptomyces sp. GbtcB6 TaxID=2824751 RepID=UPI0027E51EB6|nr:hypothetical protein [Streptomyces sp. GbtcB6]